MAGKTKISTYDKIIDKSIQLFNKHGVFNVSVQRIAAALKISPGNVTYHFKKKNDILHAILKRVEDSMEATRAQVEQLDADVKKHYEFMISIHRELWNYRFIFNNMVYLNSEDKTLGKRILRINEASKKQLHELAELSVQRGWLEPIQPPNSTKLLTENLWYIWLSWLRMSQLEAKSSGALISFATNHFFSLMSPHWNKKLGAGILEYMKADLAKS